MLIIKYNIWLTYENYGRYEKYIKFREHCVIIEKICFMTEQC